MINIMTDVHDAYPSYSSLKCQVKSLQQENNLQKSSTILGLCFTSLLRRAVNLTYFLAMREVTSQHPNSPNIASADDERSPLLQKCAASSVQQADTDDDLSTHTLSDEVSTTKLRWIMTSVWIGTFCAGLGTPYRVHSRLGQSSENKSVKDC